MKADELIPLGFSLESVLLHLMNENYNVELIQKDDKSFVMVNHFTTKNCSFVSR